ncbi:hypothetical protein [Desulfosporosinus fructosivorans]
MLDSLQYPVLMGIAARWNKFIALKNEMDNWGTGGKVLSKVLAGRENNKW